MGIDRIFIINLESRPDRRRSIANEFKRVGVPEANLEFFKAVRPSSLADINAINPRFLAQRPFWLKNTDRKHYLQYRLGALGCLLSHLAVLQIALKRGYERIVIVEDDATFPKAIVSFSTVVKRIAAEMKDTPFDILYLGGTHIKKHLTRRSQHIYRTTSTGSTVGYIIDRYIMQYIIDNAIKFGKEIDLFYIERVQAMQKSYCLLPPAIVQAAGFSDICQEHKSYRMNGFYSSAGTPNS